MRLQTMFLTQLFEFLRLFSVVAVSFHSVLFEQPRSGHTAAEQLVNSGHLNNG